MEVLAHVELDIGQLGDIVRAHRACLAWGGTADLSPADDVLISVERPFARIARLDDAPKVRNSGLALLRKLGEPVTEGDPLYRGYASFDANLAFARSACAESTGYIIGRADQVPQVFVEF